MSLKILIKYINHQYMEDKNQMFDISIIPEKSSCTHLVVDKLIVSITLDAKSFPVNKEKIPVRFVVVIDCSSSMGENNRLNCVKATIEYMLNELLESSNADKYEFCLIAFNDKVNFITETLVPITISNVNTIVEKIKGIKHEGSTNLENAIISAINISQKDSNDSSYVMNSIMLFTDGFSNGGLRGEKLIEKLKGIKIQSNIIFNTFAYGESNDSTLLNDISNLTNGGVFYYLEDNNSIPATFAECLTGIINTIACDVEVNIIGQKGCRILNTYTGFPIETHTKMKNYFVKMGSIFSSESKTILVQISINKFPNSMDKHELLKVIVSYTNGITNEKIIQENNLSIPRPSKMESARLMPLSVNKHILRNVFIQTIKTALELIGQNNFIDAKDQLIELQTDIVNSEFFTEDIDFCTNLVVDLNRCVLAMKNEETYFRIGKHYVISILNMYLYERANGVRHFKDINLTDFTLIKSTYGYITLEQDKNSVKAIQQMSVYFKNYFDNDDKN
jgi:Mg-chelatase subunit ChlD